MVMQPTHLWDFPDRAIPWPLDRPWQLREPRPEQAIGWAKTRVMNRLFVDCQLMPQCQVFQAQ
jgi:hypothetical protein